jgi:Glycosyltransferase family 87
MAIFHIHPLSRRFMSQRQLGLVAALVSIAGSVVIAVIAMRFAEAHPQTTDLAGVYATHQAQAANLECIYSRSVQLAGARLVPGDAVPATPNALPWHFNEPPVMTLLAAPLAGLNISAAVNVWELMLWLLLGLSGVVLWRGRNGLSHWLMAAVVGAMLLNEMANTGFSLAQNDALLLVVVLLALEMMRRHHDLASGVLLGLVAVKPQLIFLAIIALLFVHRWRIIAACAGTAAVIGAVGVFMVGPSCTLQWITSATQVGEFQIGIGLPGTLARLTGSSGLTDLAFVALAVIAACILWRIRTRVDVPLLVAIAIALALVVGLHTLAYDVVFLAPLGLAVARSKPWLVVATGWAFTAAQQFDSAATTDYFYKAPLKATEVVPLVAVTLAIAFLMRHPAGRETLPRIAGPAPQLVITTQ